MAWVQSVDWSILHWIQSTFRCAFLDALMPFLSSLGNMDAVWIAAALLLLCRRRYRRQGLLLLMGLAASWLASNVCLKPLVARPRPCWLDTGVALLVKNPTDFSFPSGHTLAAVVSATLLTITNRRFGWIAIPLAVGVAFSRLYLYVHFPTDVLASVLLGLVIAYTVQRLGARAIAWGNRRLFGGRLPL